MNETNTFLKLLKDERFKIAYTAILRFALLLIGVIGVPQVLYQLPRLSIYRKLMIGEHSDFIEIGIPLASMLPMFFILVYILTSHNSALRRKYSEWQDQSERSPKLAFISAQPSFWVKCVLFAALYLVLPLSVLFPALSTILHEHSISENEVTVKLILLAILFITSLTAYSSAIRSGENEAPVKPFSFVGRALLYIIVVLLIGVSLMIYIPIMIRLLPIIKDILNSKITQVALVLLISVPTISFTRALLKRRACLKKLYKLCTGINIRCDKVKRPYLSVFFPSLSVPFELKVKDKRFSCKLISGRRTYTRMRIDDDGRCHYIFPIKIRHVEAFTIKKTITFEFESANPKIIIFNPSPNYIYIERANIKTQIDNGSHVGDYQIYNSIAFLNAIERNCLGK